MGSENRNMISRSAGTRVVLSAGAVARTRGGVVSTGPPGGKSGFGQPPRNPPAANPPPNGRSPVSEPRGGGPLTAPASWAPGASGGVLSQARAPEGPLSRPPA